MKKQQTECVTSGFRSGLNNTFLLLGFYAAKTDIYRRFRPIFKGPAVQIFLDCHSTLRNIPEDLGCLTLRKVVPNRRQHITNLAVQHHRTGKISLAHSMFTVAPLNLSFFWPCTTSPYHIQYHCDAYIKKVNNSRRLHSLQHRHAKLSGPLPNGAISKLTPTHPLRDIVERFLTSSFLGRK